MIKVLSVGFGRFLLEKGIDDFKLIVRDASNYNIEINFLLRLKIATTHHQF